MLSSMHILEIYKSIKYKSLFFKESGQDKTNWREETLSWKLVWEQ